MRRAFIIAIVAAVISASTWVYYAHRNGSRRFVPSGSAVSATVFLMDPSGQPLATITNGAGLDALTKMLRSGTRVRLLHACAAAGHIETHFASGQTLSTGFAPGHEPSRYEFGMHGSSFSITRAEFLSALQAGGVDVQKIPTE
jgi:hypothetical protein